MKTVREEAARWFARLQNAPPDDPVRARFEAWLAADPAHGAEFAAFTALWEDFDATDRLKALAEAAEARARAQRAGARAGRRRLLKRGALGLLLCTGGGALLWRATAWWRAQPVAVLAAGSGVGEILRQVLPDGSRLVLGAGSAARVAYYRDRREVRLERGEAIFEVARDPDRPFIVESGLARIRVLGTRFAVIRLEDRVRVSVAAGRVDVVAPSAGGEAAGLTLGPGETAEVLAGAAPRRLARAVEDAFAWERGELVFENASLAEIAARLSRYRQKPVHVSPVAAARLPRVTAVIQIGQVEDFLQALPALAPVRVEHTAAETRILPR